MFKHILISCWLLCLFACHQNKSTKGGLSPSQALQTFRLPEGFKIELVASEPMITSPVAMEVDEYGNIYVAEMHGYPSDTAGSGKIQLLSDTNGDGLPDKNTVFADKLRLPTGIMKWKKGILVMDVPDLIYFEDTDHDGRADIRKTMITGLALTNPQHLANTPIFGLDNWIYLAHTGTITPKISMMFNDRGSLVRYTDNPSARQLPRNADGRNLRLKPDSFQMEMLSGETQYGQTFDDWGHHFCVNNSNHIYHEAIAARYLQRNANLPVEDASEYISDHSEACEVYPVTINPQTQLLTDLGVITSACGLTWYNGGLFPDSFKNVSFVAEPVSNTVHADRVTDKGASFNAARVYEKKEFLASTDAWFRPVQFYIGPDGALYVIDYYRQIIEHPEWLSDSVIKSGALYNGEDRGRIYRITPANAPKMNWCTQLKLGDASAEELVRNLTSNNIWWRRNAQRLLMDRKDPQTPALVQHLLDTTRSATATVHALWLMEGFNATNITELRKALRHPVAGVRENAIQIAELHLKDLPQLQEDLLAMQNDTAAKVRYQLLCTIGDIDNVTSETARQNLLMRDIDDKWVQIAALASSKGKEYELMEKSISSLESKPSAGIALFFSNCAAVIGLSQRETDIKRLIKLSAGKNRSSSDWWQSACLKGLTAALSSKGIPGNWEPEKMLLVSKFSSSTPPLVRSASIKLLSLLGIPQNRVWSQALANARSVAEDNAAGSSYREDALQLLALDKKGNYTTLLEQIIGSPASPETLQETAIQTYNALSPKAACAYMVRHWSSFGYDTKESAMDAFLSSADNSNILLNAIKNDSIPASSISWSDKVSLMNDGDVDILNRSRKLFSMETGNRDAVIKKYQEALTLKGDMAKGLVVFKTVCATCHNLEGKYGHAFGPDLGSIRNRDAASIMTDILNPNRSIAVKFDMWTITKKNDEKTNGIIASQTPASITLNHIGGSQSTIDRSAIKTMETSPASAMPVGLESSISPQQMADLLALLKNNR
ncbi:MAG: dehydrogenase [Bacteroidota bacterium]|nr:dehydrogenase [Bacteroidota bacterium]